MGGARGEAAGAAAREAGGARHRAFLFSGARTLECDKQGRFLVPANLRAYADITLRQPVVLAGADNRIEVWSKEQWSRYNEEVEPDVTAIAASLAELGI